MDRDAVRLGVVRRMPNRPDKLRITIDGKEVSEAEALRILEARAAEGSTAIMAWAKRFPRGCTGKKLLGDRQGSPQ